MGCQDVALLPFRASFCVVLCLETVTLGAPSMGFHNVVFLLSGAIF